jgi:hypothetical protein
MTNPSGFFCTENVICSLRAKEATINNFVKLADVVMVVILIAGCTGPATQQRSSIGKPSFPITISWEKQFTSPMKPSNLPAIAYKNHSKKGVSKGVYAIQYTCTGSGMMGSKLGTPIK